MDQSNRHRDRNDHRYQSPPPRDCLITARGVGAVCPGAPRKKKKKKPGYHRSTSPLDLPSLGRYHLDSDDVDERSPTNNNRNSIYDPVDGTQQEASTLMRRQAPPPPVHHHDHHQHMLVDIQPRRLFDNYHNDNFIGPHFSSVSLPLENHQETTSIGTNFSQLRLLREDNDDEPQHNSGRNYPVDNNDYNDDQRTR